LPFPLDSERLEEFARRIAAHPRRRVDRAAIWSAFATAFPARPRGAEERAWLAEAINRLAARGMVRLPAQRGPRWDRTMGIALPLSLDLQRELRAPNREWRRFPWHARLQWISDMKSLPVEQERFLSRVHEGLVAGWFACSAPMKYRSFQLTGDEKMLTRLRKTKLFGPSRLDLPLLGCFEDLPPLAWERISAKPALIVFENTGPFAVARQALASMPDPPYGMVACGEGARFQRSLAQLMPLREVLQRIEYVGDLTGRAFELRPRPAGQPSWPGCRRLNRRRVCTGPCSLQPGASGIRPAGHAVPPTQESASERVYSR